jgi:hypothetical protein
MSKPSHSLPGVNNVLDKVEAHLRELGVARYVVILEDPDSDQYGARTSDTVWATGGMLKYLKHLLLGGDL